MSTYASKIKEGVFLEVFLRPGQGYSGNPIIASLEAFANHKEISNKEIKQGEERWPADGSFTFPLAETGLANSNAKPQLAQKNDEIELDVPSV